MDLMPTFLDIAGQSHPNPGKEGPRGKADYKGHMVSAITCLG